MITAEDKHVLVHLPDGDLLIAEKVEPMPRVSLTPTSLFLG